VISDGFCGAHKRVHCRFQEDAGGKHHRCNAGSFGESELRRWIRMVGVRGERQRFYTPAATLTSIEHNLRRLSSKEPGCESRFAILFCRTEWARVVCNGTHHTFGSDFEKEQDAEVIKGCERNFGESELL
jgi:hypothetical protein